MSSKIKYRKINIIFLYFIFGELESENDCNIENVLGKIVYRMSFEYAINNNYISNYEIYLPIHDKDNYNLLIKEIKINDYDELLIKKVLYYFAIKMRKINNKIYLRLKPQIYFIIYFRRMYKDIRKIKNNYLF